MVKKEKIKDWFEAKTATPLQVLIIQSIITFIMWILTGVIKW